MRVTLEWGGKLFTVDNLRHEETFGCLKRKVFDQYNKSLHGETLCHNEKALDDLSSLGSVQEEDDPEREDDTLKLRVMAQVSRPSLHRKASSPAGRRATLPSEDLYSLHRGGGANHALPAPFHHQLQQSAPMPPMAMSVPSTPSNAQLRKAAALAKAAGGHQHRQAMSFGAGTQLQEITMTSSPPRSLMRSHSLAPGHLVPTHTRRRSRTLSHMSFGAAAGGGSGGGEVGSGSGANMHVQPMLQYQPPPTTRSHVLNQALHQSPGGPKSAPMIHRRASPELSVSNAQSRTAMMTPQKLVDQFPSSTSAAMSTTRLSPERQTMAGTGSINPFDEIDETLSRPSPKPSHSIKTTGAPPGKVTLTPRHGGHAGSGHHHAASSSGTRSSQTTLNRTSHGHGHGHGVAGAGTGGAAGAGEHQNGAHANGNAAKWSPRIHELRRANTIHTSTDQPFLPEISASSPPTLARYNSTASALANNRPPSPPTSHTPLGGSPRASVVPSSLSRQNSLDGGMSTTGEAGISDDLGHHIEDLEVEFRRISRERESAMRGRSAAKSQCDVLIAQIATATAELGIAKNATAHHRAQLVKLKQRLEAVQNKKSSADADNEKFEYSFIEKKRALTKQIEEAKSVNHQRVSATREETEELERQTTKMEQEVESERQQTEAALDKLLAEQSALQIRHRKAVAALRLKQEQRKAQEVEFKQSIAQLRRMLGEKDATQEADDARIREVSTLLEKSGLKQRLQKLWSQ